jgi:alpha-L-fucosidase
MPCNATDPTQQWTVNAAASTVSPASSPSQCVTFDAAGGTYNAPLILSPCGTPTPPATQLWAYAAGPTYAFSNPAGQCGGLKGACIQWSGQESATCTSNPPALGAGCLVGTWPTAEPTSWNNELTLNAGGQIEALWKSATGPSPSGLCVAAVAPPKPIPPTPTILAWQDLEVGCLYDFDLCVMTAGTRQGCACSSSPPDPAAVWDGSALDTDSWIDAGIAAGCNLHILVAKHMCGHVLWPSRVGEDIGYNFSTAYLPAPKNVDIVGAFMASAQAKGQQRTGLYYSLTNNARVNMCAGNILPNPGANQIAVNMSQYVDIVQAHLTEIWGGKYGALEEVWFDGSYTPALSGVVSALLAKYLPDAVGFNAGGLMPNPTRWIGSETGYAPYPTWSTTNTEGEYGPGEPGAPVWAPAETDFTVLDGDTWFFDPNTAVRSPATLRAMYESSVGRNSNALIGLGIPPNGTVAGSPQAAAMAGLGAYVAGCYGSPVVTVSGGPGQTFLTVMPSAPVSIDRAYVMEDQTAGQLVRSFEVTFFLQNGSRVVVDSGTSVGHKKITALNATVDGVTLATLNITSSSAPPTIRTFSLFSGCLDLGARIDAAWAAGGV